VSLVCVESEGVGVCLDGPSRIARPGLPYRVTALAAGRSIPGLVRAAIGGVGMGVKLLDRRCEECEIVDFDEEAIDFKDTLALPLREGALLPTALIAGLRNTDESTRLKSSSDLVRCIQPFDSKTVSRLLDSASAGRGICGVVGEASSYAAQKVRIVSRFKSTGFGTGMVDVFGEGSSYAAQNVRIESIRLAGVRDVISPIDMGRIS